MSRFQPDTFLKNLHGKVVVLTGVPHESFLNVMELS